MELWSPPRDEPHLFEWWRPLVQASRLARVARFPWPVHIDEFRLAGRVVRGERPDVWIYEHHANGGSLCVDDRGRTYRFVATPNGPSPGQFRRCALRAALWRAGLPEVVEPVAYGRPVTGPLAARPADDELDEVVDEHDHQDTGGRPVLVRRRHLALVAGSA